MFKIQSAVVLAALLVGSISHAQLLNRPYRINKSPAQMQAEATQSAQYFKRRMMDNIPPAKFDLLKYQTPVKEQGQRGTCVAFASTAQVESMYMIKNNQQVDLSEQFAYWASKAVEQVAPYQDGSLPLEFLKSVEKNGIPAEAAWRYEPVGWFEDEVKHPGCVAALKKSPEKIPTACVTNGHAPAQALSAPKVKVVNAHRVPSAAEAIMGFLQNGVPVQVAVDVYEKAWSFDKKDSPEALAGIVKFPMQGDKLIGGHAVLIIGYDRDAKVFIFKNSWGTKNWSSRSRYPGYGFIPFDYVRKFGEAVVAQLP